MERIGTIYLIPIPITDGGLNTLSKDVEIETGRITHFFVENVRTARRFLKSIHPSIVIDDLRFSEIDKHKGPELNLMKQWLKAGHDVGIMSEAGCPGIADPGAELVAMGQSMGATIVPLVGPNSIILALMASGLNGQSFCFNGYLPIKEPERSKHIRSKEQISLKEKQTQIYIETPYRNNQLLDDLIKNCTGKTRICIAQNVTAENALIKTKTAAEWKQNKPALEKLPAVFLLLA